MGHLDHMEVLWICTGCLGPVGIVKAWDGIEGRWKFFIGPCEGRDLDGDVERIVALGQKFYSLEHIAAFGDLTPPEDKVRMEDES